MSNNLYYPNEYDILSNDRKYDYVNNYIGPLNDSKEEKRPKTKKKNENDKQITNNNQEKKLTNNNDKKELNDGPKDSINQNKKEKGKDSNENQKKYDTSNIINDYYNQILRKTETRLLTDSQYVSFENKIGENSCYINVIIHFLYIFPCVNDYLIRKYNKNLEKELKEKERLKKTDKGDKKEKEEQKEKNNQTDKNRKENNGQNDNERKTEKEISKPNNNENNSNNKNLINGKTPIEKEEKRLKKPEKKVNNDFLFNLGKILNDYQNILSSTDNNNKISKLTTNQLRKSLSIASNNLFKLNNISDPIELLIYILDLINKENLEEIHLYFHLILIEEIRCNNFCPYKNHKKYDKDNYIYQIYVEDIFNYIKKHKLNFDEYRERLFMLSYYSLQNEDTKCEKCNSIMNKTLICNNKQGSPKFLLINCVWNNAKPEIEDVVNFLYLISLIEELDNLFLCPNKVQKENYYLMGIIFYSFSLCHYINMIFNIQKNVFTLYNDEGILEFYNINDLYRYITIEQIKNNNKAYFYPVLLVYGKENIYDDNILSNIKKNNKANHEILVQECKNEVKINYTKKEEEKPLTQEEKDKNYQELVLAQIKFNREQEINRLLSKNINKPNYDYYKNFKCDDDNKKINIINKFMKGNYKKSGSVDKNNNYLNINNILNNPSGCERRNNEFLKSNNNFQGNINNKNSQNHNKLENKNIRQYPTYFPYGKF